MRRKHLVLLMLVAAAWSIDQCVASQRSHLSFWRELGASENGVVSGEGGGHSLYIHLWDVTGFPLANKEIYANTNILLGITDTNGFLEVPMTETNAYRLAGYLGGLGGSLYSVPPIFNQNRLPLAGRYSWEVGMMGGFSLSDNFVPFNTNYDGVLNSAGANMCLDLSAPAMRSIIYYPAGTNYCGDRASFGPVGDIHAQSFVSDGNRIVAARVRCAGPDGQPVRYTVQFFESGLTGAAIGPPRTSWIPSAGAPQSVLLRWGINEIRTLPGQRYYMRVTSDAGPFAAAVTTNLYARGEYWRDDQPSSSMDIDAMIVAGEFPSGTIVMELRDPNGNPLSGATVHTHAWPDEFDAVSYPNGKYILQSLPSVFGRTYTVGITNNGFVSIATNLAALPGGTNLVRLTLQPDRVFGSVLATVVDDPNGAPLKGAQVRIYPREYQMTTDPDGYVESTALMPGAYWLAVWKSGFSPIVVTNVTASSGSTNLIRIRMVPQLLLNGSFEGGETSWTRVRLLTNSIETLQQPTNRLSGRNALAWLRTNSIYDRAFFQQAAVVSGSLYQFACWTWRFDPFEDGQSNLESWVGIDPLGGTNAASPDVIWSAPESSRSVWTRQLVTAAAQSNMITVFIRSRANRAGNPMLTMADDATLGGPSPYPSGLMAEAGDRVVRLKWYRGDENASFTIKRVAVQQPAAVVTFPGVTMNEFVDKGVSNGVTYAFSVSEVINGTAGPYCPAVNVRPEALITILPAGMRWKYRDDASNQGTAWRGTNFNDATWLSGFARLGFGGDGEVTLLDAGTNSATSPITVYFRHEFMATNAARYTNLGVRLVRDDGAVVYLNGTEIVRSNMPPGVISYTTFALSSVSGADETTFFATSRITNGLRNGRNVIAVELHQAFGSTDLGFDLELVGYMLERPTLRIQSEGNRLYLIWPTNYSTAVAESRQGLDSSSWQRVTEAGVQRDGDFWLQIPGDGQRFYRLVE